MDNNYSEKPAPVKVPGKLENLQADVQKMMQESQDAQFTAYLGQMQKRLVNQQYQIDLLADELAKRYRMYQNNIKATPEIARPVSPAPGHSAPVSSEPEIVGPVAQAAPLPEALPAKQKNMEFTIGAAVLSIIGSVFILAALLLLGINFMNGLVKGISLFVIFTLLVAVSELLLYRKWPRLGATFSALGMGGLYLSAMINYLALKNFNMWVTFAVIFVISVVVFLVSWKRNSVVYRILGMAAVYTCILIIPVKGWFAEGIMSQAEFLVMTVILLIMNLMCLMLPVYKSHTAIHVTHMSLNTFFTLLACLLWTKGNAELSFAQVWHYMIFLAISLLMMQLIFIGQVRLRAKQKLDGGISDNMEICIAYGISAFFYTVMTMEMTELASSIVLEEATDLHFWIYRLICAGVTAIICALPLILLRDRQEKWFAWYLANPLLLAIYVSAGGSWEMTGCLVFLLVVSKLFSLGDNIMPRISDAVLTALACVVVLVEHKNIYVLPLFAALLLSILCIHYWKIYYEIVLTFTIALYTSQHMLTMLKLPVFVGILFAGMLLFNNVRRWQSKRILLYNGLMVAGQTICFLLLMDPLYYKAYLTYMCMLIFGISTIVICFQKKYQMDFELKHMVFVFFLSYMAVLIQTGYPIINSILLMLIALISVGLGFARQKKEVRIFGLALSFVVCGKIVLYDFAGATVLQRTIVFFAVGVLALATSAIYMVLEKKQGKNQKSAEQEVAVVRDVDGNREIAMEQEAVGSREIGVEQDTTGEQEGQETE